MGNGKWEMGNGKWEMGNGKWEMGNGKVTVLSLRKVKLLEGCDSWIYPRAFPLVPDQVRNDSLVEKLKILQK